MIGLGEKPNLFGDICSDAWEMIWIRGKKDGQDNKQPSF